MSNVKEKIVPEFIVVPKVNLEKEIPEIIMESKVNLEKETLITISPRKKVNLDKTEAIENNKKEKQIKLTNKIFEEYTKDIDKFVEHRVFIPDSDSYDSNILIYKLLGYLEEKTGLYFISYTISEEETCGTFIMKAECLLDKDRKYTYSDDIVYSEDGTPYHVSYYQQKGILHIILDNPESSNDFKVVSSLNNFSHEKQELISDIDYNEEQLITVEESQVLSTVEENTDDSDTTISILDNFDKGTIVIIVPALLSLGSWFAAHSLFGPVEEKAAELLTDTSELTIAEVEMYKVQYAMNKAMRLGSNLLSLVLIITATLKLFKKVMMPWTF